MYVTRGGVKKSENFADVLYGSPLRLTPNLTTGGDGSFVIDTTQLLLRRTASEESLSVMKGDPHESNSPVALAAMSARLARRRPAAHRKGRAPAPPGGTGGAPVVRSNSVTQARLDGKRTDWYRSRSTTRYDCAIEMIFTCDETETCH